MDSITPPQAELACPGLDLRVAAATAVATLRYFAREGGFVRAVHEATDAVLPQTLQACEAGAGAMVLAWRSPTETLCVTPDPERLRELASRLAGEHDGQLIDMSGGLKVVRLHGERIADLLCRLGGRASVPQVGEARRSRLADVPVLAFSVRAGDTCLIVDRGYLPHLLGWCRETLLDFANP
jgi:heterotetrameric sarcosine oxidase gamma subunit